MARPSEKSSFHAGRPITGDASADDRLLLVYSLGGESRPRLIGATVVNASGSKIDTS